MAIIMKSVLELAIRVYNKMPAPKNGDRHFLFIVNIIHSTVASSYCCIRISFDIFMASDSLYVTGLSPPSLQGAVIIEKAPLQRQLFQEEHPHEHNRSTRLFRQTWTCFNRFYNRPVAWYKLRHGAPMGRPAGKISLVRQALHRCRQCASSCLP